jgi:subtilisin family serine protease
MSKPKQPLAQLAALGLALLLAIPATAAPSLDAVENAAGIIGKSPNGIYIVKMSGDPVVAYNGDIKGLKATKPRKGKKINPKSRAVTEYVDYLTARHDAALAKVNGKKVYSFKYVFNGFAAELSHGQAKKLQRAAGIEAIAPDELRSLDTATTPAFLGLEDEGGLWDQLGGIGQGGEDVIIGIVDGGIWPESLSFTDRIGTNGNGSKDGKLAYQQIPGWNGKCTPGEAFNASHCNQKMIGGRYYNSGWGGNDGIDAQLPWEYNSPRDFGGHGTHVASTSGGNYDTPLTGDAEFFGSVSGIAPRARIATYKVCWETGSGGSCFTSDSVAAIDQAVADGVDVINYSISGSRTNFLDAVEVAFLFAADAGVFVAASAGNSGPGASTVAHPSPWITTVAASTHDRNYDADVALGNGDSYSGASTNETGAGPAELVYSANVGLGDADSEEVRLCYPGTLDPALVTGKIVLCDRGAIARVDKSLAVYQAGGVGSILANPNPDQSLNADFHSVPTVHVDNVAGDAIRTYATTDPSPMAEIFPSYFAPVPAPVIANFSSRGPLLAGDGDMLKPDLSAPGVSVLAAVAPPWNFGQDFALYSGTSMSSPHVAGLAALLKDRHPGWSPMAIKSALMTTGYDLLSGADPFAQGAGHVDPNSAADPGLVYDHGWNDWLGFLCGTGQLVASYCPLLEIDPSDLNVASIAVGSLIGPQDVVRTVTNVSDSTETYTFSYDVPGIDIVATPAEFTVAPGESASYTLNISNDSAPTDTYATGFVTWTGDNGHVARSPVAVQPIYFAADDEVSATGTDGNASINVTFGYDGPYTAAPHGLVPATTQAGNVDDDPGNDYNSALGTCDFNSFPFDCVGISWHAVPVPAGTAITRIRLFDDYTDGADDLDLYVYDAGFNFVGGSFSFTSAEQVDVVFPASPVYFVAVHGWQTDGADANYVLFDFSVSATPGGSLMIDSAPEAAVAGDPGTVEVSWAGLAPDMKYMGAVSHADGGGLIGLSLVRVDTD